MKKNRNVCGRIPLKAWCRDRQHPWPAQIWPDPIGLAHV